MTSERLRHRVAQHSCRRVPNPFAAAGGSPLDPPARKLLDWHRRPSRQAGRLAVPGRGCGGLVGVPSSPLPTARHKKSPTKNAKNVGNPRFRRGVAYKKGQKRRRPTSKTGGCQQKWPKMRGTHYCCERPRAENGEKCSWSRFAEGYQEQKTRKTDLGTH